MELVTGCFGDSPGITWTCHVCGDERPDAKVGVYSAERLIGVVGVRCNIRYCRDRPDCVAGAPYVDFWGTGLLTTLDPQSKDFLFVVAEMP